MLFLCGLAIFIITVCQNYDHDTTAAMFWIALVLMIGGVFS